MIHLHPVGMMKMQVESRVVTPFATVFFFWVGLFFLPSQVAKIAMFCRVFPGPSIKRQVPLVATVFFRSFAPNFPEVAVGLGYLFFRKCIAFLDGEASGAGCEGVFLVNLWGTNDGCLFLKDVFEGCFCSKKSGLLSITVLLSKSWTWGIAIVFFP